jgi:two-component sensor histidine kinase
VELNDTGHALTLMAQTISEGFALLHLGPNPGVKPSAVYANPALTRMIGAAQGLHGFCDRIGLDLTAACRGALRERQAVVIDVGDASQDLWLRLRLEPAGAQHLSMVVLDRSEEQRAARRHAEAFAELHHRVKNSLANAASLLKLQATPDADPRLVAAIEQAANRIHAIADLHGLLYAFESQDAVDLGVYVRDFCERLAQSLFEDGRVRVKVTTEEAMAPFEQAAPFGIILNELVTNAAKHAYPAPGVGEICVELRTEPNTLVLRVSDTGRGFAGGAERPGGLGMRLVRSLVKQLQGELIVQTTGMGAAFELRAPRAIRGTVIAQAQRLL